MSTVEDTPRMDRLADAGDPPAPTVPRRGPSDDHLFWASLVVVLVPIVVATVRAAQNDWLPVGDNGLFLIRSRDVLTSHHPLLSTWTSASLNSDSHFNHPGPLIFDLLALPTKLFGPIGLAIGSAIVNGLSAAGIGLMARRRGGVLVGTAALLVTALLCSSMGSELLYDPWNPHVVLLPFLFLLTCVWSLGDGDLAALPWSAAAASLVVQTHLSYALLVAALGGWGVASLVVALRRERAGDPDHWAGRRRSVARAVAVALVVAGLCWLQPLVENFTSDGAGNLARLAHNMSSSEETIGVDRGTRIVADSLTVPPFWLRPSFEETLAYERLLRARPGELPSVEASFPVAAGLLAALGLVLVALGWDARRRADRVVVAGLATAGIAIAVELATAWRLPVGIVGVAAHQFRWMWPIAAFTTLALLVAGLHRVATTPRRARRALVALAALTALVAISTLPTYNVRSGPVSDASAATTLRAAMDQMGALEGRGTILMDVNGIRFAEPYSTSIMAELQRRGVPFTVEDEGLVRQLGEDRREVGNASHRLLFREGDAARDGVPGARRVVYVEGLTAAEKGERADLRDALIDHFAAEGMPTRDLESSPLPPAHKDAVPTGAHPDPDAVATVIDRGILAYLVDHGYLVADDAWQDRLERFAELERRWAQRTLGLFLAPIDDDGGP